MKTKGINVFELHVEKVVFGLAVVLFVGILALQFVSAPTVSVGTAELPPDRAYEPAETAAQRLNAAMTAEDPEMPEYEAPELVAAFNEAIADAPETTRLARLGQGISIGALESDTDVGGGDLVVAQIEPGAPTNLRYSVNQSTIDPVAASENPELRELLPASQPFDKSSVTVEALYDGEALARQLEADPEGEAGPLPRAWWLGAIELMGVELERQRLGDDGKWGATESVPASPGLERPLAILEQAEAVNREVMVRAVALAGQNRTAVARPDYPRVLAGPEWMSPGQAERQAQYEANLPRIRQIENRREQNLALIAEAEAKLGNTTQPLTPAQRTQEEATITRLQGEVEGMEAELFQLGWNPEGEDQAERAAPQLLEAADLSIWAHDLTAEPGASYRYRMRVIVNNPIFGKGLALNETQQDLAQQPTVASAWSDWSGPVSVISDRYAFVTRSRTEDLDGRTDPGATAELYRFYYGYWRRETVGLEPGDPLRGSVSLSGPLPIFEIEQPAEGAPGRAEINRVPGPESLDVDTGLILLDVAQTGRDASLVFLRGADGGIETRDPASDADSDLRDRLIESVRASTEQQIQLGAAD